MREVQLYINNKRVDLFGDEKISITSSIQNIQDISKVYTDFSQSFTVPCSDNNNAIFDYFYNNDVDGTFDVQVRADARIEINNVPFRSGKIQLESADIKSNEANNYKVTFYGDVVTIKDLFGDKKLKDLDYSTIAFEYTGANVNNSIQSTSDLDVRFPLISSNRVWTYGNGGTEDISIPAGNIVFDELYPAIKDKAILDIIETEFGVNFSGNFFNSDYFQKSFTYWKNSTEARVTSPPVQLTFNDTTSGSTLVNNQILVSHIPMPSGAMFGIHTATVDISTSPSVAYDLDIYINDILTTTLNAVGTNSHQILNLQDNVSLNDVYTINIRSEGATGVTGDVTYTFNYYTNFPFTQNLTTYTTGLDALTLTGDIDFQISAPDIKISDWFSGILKEFNLTCYPLEADKTYQIEPLEQWYNYGGELNITPYTDIETIKINRVKLYKNIVFEWEKSKAFLNETFEGNNNRSYGNLKLGFPYDGGEFKVKLPFENMLFQRFTGTDLQVSFVLDAGVSGKTYIPKPVKLFMDESKAVSFYFYNGTSQHEVESYMPFGQDQVYNSENYSQNFGLDMSTLKDIAITNSLYQTFYEPYLQNLFNPKTREVTVKCHLPLDKLTMLTLDDTIILRDKRYRINSMKTDLTSGEVNLVLLSDWSNTKGKIPAPTTSFNSNEHTIKLPIKILKPDNPIEKFGGGGTVTFDATRETQFITLTLPVTFTSDGTLDITIPANTTGDVRTQVIPVTYKNASGSTIKNENILLIQAG